MLRAGLGFLICGLLIGLLQLLAAMAGIWEPSSGAGPLVSVAVGGFLLLGIAGLLGAVLAGQFPGPAPRLPRDRDFE